MNNKFLLGFLCVFVLSTSGHAASAADGFSFSFTTTKGKMQFDCPKDWSPLGAERLQELIRVDFFNEVAVFRVITGFVAQFGISGDPTIAAKWENAVITDDPVLASNVAGTLTYATAGPDTRTTQLFINLADNPRLDKLGFSPVCKMVDAQSLTIARLLYAGYGEVPDQDLITKQGNSYLKATFPNLDYIVSAELVR
jgi:peptidyl-prolyl cis-trans isomerase A (cyclophilin A)